MAFRVENLPLGMKLVTIMKQVDARTPALVREKSPPRGRERHKARTRAQSYARGSAR